jgi:hypothetical protein
MMERNSRLAGFLLAVLMMIGSSAVWAAPVTAELDRQRIVEGETVTLILVTNDPQQSLETDLSALDEGFHVVDTRSETQMSIVNGRQAAVVRLLVTLEPRQSGEVMIPSLKFRGGSVTPAMTLQVDPAPELAPGELPPVFIEVELDPIEGPYYVHAQLSLKVRIFYQQNLTEAAINPPDPEQASVRLLDELPYQAERNGTRFRVLERRYAIFPERSGELQIPAMQLTGRLIERPADRLWQPSVRGRRVRIESEPVSLDISPRPPEFQGDHWLPARRIDLSQQISDADSLHVGEPVTRTVILDAVGLEEHMLEEPVWPEMDNARIYPDQPQGISRDDGQWVLGHREFRYAVVPEVAGEMVLPEIRLRWWDTVEGRERVAVLPEHRIEVLPSTLAPSRPVTEAAQALGSEFRGGAGMVDDATLNRWRVLAGVFALLWLITLVLYFRGGRAPEPSDKRAEQPAADEASLLASLQKACNQGAAREARNLLGRWVRNYGPPGTRDGLMAFADKAGDPALGNAIRALDANSFSVREDGEWEGKTLWRSLEQWRKAEGKRARQKQAQSYELYSSTG